METELMKQMVRLMLPCPDVLQLEALTMDVQQQQVTLEVTTLQATSSCPRCQVQSDRIHSYYQRTVADLPWADIRVCLHLEVRKCFCLNPICTPRIFSERLPGVVAPWARRTQRLAEQQRAIGFALGGVPSQRLSEQLDCSASRDTFLRLVRTTPTAEMPTQRYIGVDDWALCKGHTYGSIVIDLERSVILDLLPDRSAETFAHWLREHPGIKVISRDRGGSYADGAAIGAPDAVQVADRWHLLKNLGDALTNLFDQHRSAIEQRLRPSANMSEAAQDIDFSLSPSTSTTAEQPLQPVVPLAKPQLSKRQLEQQARRRERRLAPYEQVCQLSEQGWTVSAIADQIGIDRTTVRKYVQAADFPELQPRAPRASRLDPFKPYILQRWNAGCHTGAILLREIEQQGYRGGASICHAYIAHLRRASGLPPKKRWGMQAQAVSDTPRIPSSRGLVWLVLRRAETLEEDDQQCLSQLFRTHTDVATAITLAQAFATIVRERQPEQLDTWLTRTEQSGIAPLISFAKGIRRDYAAVKTGVTLEFSNGATEGHINRLKMLKRTTFGRAKLDLLKKRLMAA